MMRVLRRAAQLEATMWRSLFRWVLRRPRTTEPGARTFGYSRTVAPVLFAFIAVSAVELPILHFLLPWPPVRFVADIISVYGLLWMFGLLASLRVNPHIVAASGLRLRGGGGSLDVTIPWEYVASVRATNRSLPGKDTQVNGAVLSIGVLKQTSVDVTFRQPTILELPKGDTEPVTELRFAADDPGALVAAAREHLPARSPAAAQA
jgi:hypothetical protein